MMFKATPSWVSSTAWAWRSWCGANRRRTPAWVARRCSSNRTLEPDQPRPGGAIDDTQQRADRQLGAGGEPRTQLLPAPGVHPDLAPPPALAVTDEQRPATLVEVGLQQRQ